MASGHVEVALGALAAIARDGASESARVSASVAILDRVYGRPAQAVHHEGIEAAAAPTVIQIVPADVSDALDTIAAKLSES